MRLEERTFLTSIKEAITLNPFSSERRNVDLSLTEMSSDNTGREIFGKLNHQIQDKIKLIIGRNGNLLRNLNDEDRRLVRYTFLFQIFYQYCDYYDRLIEDQINKGEISSDVAFADDFLDKLKSFQFTNDEALRYFALFYQMRRGFFFINKISGISPCVQKLKMSLWNNIFTKDIGLYDSYLWNRMEDFSTMLLGETGTGKGLAASAIGRSGFIPFDKKNKCFKESFAKTFVSINLSQFPEQLIESELFGHKKGAFTGAIDAHQGIFSKCSPFGAIFIDELGDVSVPVQIKLLQVLQERFFSPVGSHHTERFAGRVIAATNQPIDEMRREGKFREDFYYRICSDVIEVPPLRQRLSENPEELKTILSFIIKRIVGRSSEELVEDSDRYIKTHQPENYLWPGNIRELEQCVRQLLLRGTYRWQEKHDDNQNHYLKEIADGTLTAQQLLCFYCTNLYKKLGSYEAVGRATGLDRRTVKKHMEKSCL